MKQPNSHNDWNKEWGLDTVPRRNTRRGAFLTERFKFFAIFCKRGECACECVCFPPPAPPLAWGNGRCLNINRSLVDVVPDVLPCPKPAGWLSGYSMEDAKVLEE